MGVLPAHWLSWGSARLLALLLNALTGLLQHLEEDTNRHTRPTNANNNPADWDVLFGMRVIQEHLMALDMRLRERNVLHPAIFEAIRNLSAQNELLMERRAENARKADPELFKKFKPLFRVRTRFVLGAHKKLDESLRWADKQHEDRNAAKQAEAEGKKTGREELWLGPKSPMDGCLADALAQCTLSDNCSAEIGQKGRVGFAFTRQLFHFLLISDQFQKCTTPNASVAPAELVNGTEKESFLAERCVNMFDELSALAQRNRKRKLAKLGVRTFSLLMEQVFLCGHLGFVQLADPHILLAALSWQHPQLGCWTAKRADPVPNLGIQAALEIGHRPKETGTADAPMSDEQELCLPHTSIVVGMSLAAVFLRLLLDPGPWPEHSLADQLVQLEGVPAEDRFRAFPYLEWVRDSAIVEAAGPGLRLLRPPSSSWSPDLIAFVGLLFFIVLCLVVAVHFCGDYDANQARMGGLRKKMYPYAFKKL